MKHQGDRPIDLHEAAKVLRAKDLCGVERYFREKGCPEFEYDGELDGFRFTEDGGFAFCREFADRALLWERGYLDF